MVLVAKSDFIPKRALKKYLIIKEGGQKLSVTTQILLFSRERETGRSENSSFCGDVIIEKSHNCDSNRRTRSQARVILSHESETLRPKHTSSISSLEIAHDNPLQRRSNQLVVGFENE